MTSLPALYDRLYRAESAKADLKAIDPRYYSRDQIRIFNRRRRYLARVIKKIKHEISIHPNYKKL